MSSLRRGAMLCAFVVVAAVLSTLPFVEMGLNDDWSFAFIANGFARTGRIAYNGWAAPLLGFQVVWGGWLIRIFGFSFNLLRFSLLPFAAGCAWVVYALGRRAGLNHSTAVFGALALSLSPVFIPLAASFMTDVPALFFWLACFYYGLLAAEASSDKRCIAWLAAAAVAGFAGGTIRQVVWAAPLAVLPSVAWIWRRSRRVTVSASALWCGTAAAAAMCLRWYQAQPGHEPVPTASWQVIIAGLATPVRIMTLAALVAVVPVLLLFLTGWRRWLRAPAAPVIGSLGAAAFVGACVWWFEDELLMGNLVTIDGILKSGTEAMGGRPVILCPSVIAGLGAALCLGAGFAAAWCGDAWRTRREWLARAAPLGRLVFLIVPSCALYTAAVSFRFASDGILFDRYLLYLTPPLIIFLLWLYQSRVRSTPSRLAWAVLVLFGAYGVAATHDYIAGARARLRAASRVTASGVPRTRVSGGLEYDGWTQLEVAGRIPPFDWQKAHPRKFAMPEPYWFWQMARAVEPQYVVAYTPVEGLLPSEFPPVEYEAWLPPFRRQVLTEKIGARN